MSLKIDFLEMQSAAFPRDRKEKRRRKRESLPVTSLPPTYTHGQTQTLVGNIETAWTRHIVSVGSHLYRIQLYRTELNWDLDGTPLTHIRNINRSVTKPYIVFITDAPADCAHVEIQIDFRLTADSAKGSLHKILNPEHTICICNQIHSF